MSDINIGAIGEALNNKVDLPTPNTAQDSVDYVVERQDPTADNGYTWYRKYKSGWVEQGGVFATQTTSLTFPVEMADTNYCWWINAAPANNTNFRKYSATKATTGLTGLSELYGTSSAHATHAYWEATAMWHVSGLAA